MIILVIFSQQFQGTIVLMVFDLQGDGKVSIYHPLTRRPGNNPQMTEQYLVRHSLQDNILDQVGRDEHSATNEIFTSLLQQTPQTELPQFVNQY